MSFQFQEFKSKTELAIHTHVDDGCVGIKVCKSVLSQKSNHIVDLETPLYTSNTHIFTNRPRLKSYRCRKMKSAGGNRSPSISPNQSRFSKKCSKRKSIRRSIIREVSCLPLRYPLSLKAPHGSIFWNPKPCWSSPPARLPESGTAFITNSWLAMHTSLIYTAGAGSAVVYSTSDWCNGSTGATDKWTPGPMPRGLGFFPSSCGLWCSSPFVAQQENNKPWHIKELSL